MNIERPTLNVEVKRSGFALLCRDKFARQAFEWEEEESAFRESAIHDLPSTGQSCPFHPHAPSAMDQGAAMHLSRRSEAKTDESRRSEAKTDDRR
jgi:hypothetical protein